MDYLKTNYEDDILTYIEKMYSKIDRWNIYPIEGKFGKMVREQVVKSIKQVFWAGYEAGRHDGYVEKVNEEINYKEIRK